MRQQEPNIPALRFPEFSEKWKNVRFEKVGTVIRGASPRPKGDPRYYGGTVPRLMVEDVARDGKYANPISDSLTEKGAQLSRFCPKGTLTIVCSGTAKTVGQAAFLAKDACIHDGFLALINIKKGHSQDFIYYVVQKFQEHSERMATHGGTFINLTTSILKDFTRGFPSYKEQQKIAAFLGAVDEKIASLQKRKDLLEDYKKGCMQKLFSQEIRFTDDSGKPFPDWEEKRLNQLVTKSASTVTAQSLEGRQGDFPVFGASGIAGYINSYASERQHIGVIKDGAGVGRVCLCPAKSSVLGTLESLAANNTNDIVFVYQWLSNMSFEPYKTGTTIPHVYFRDYGKKKAKFPHPDEQKKIAEFLSAIDNKIALVSEELEKAKTFKKGLLQQMFV